jgi:hypothetical protein
MLQELGDVVNNPDIAENFQILRNPGVYAQGGWQGSTQQSFSVYGTVSLASQKEIQMLPDADHVTEARIFHSSTPMYVTSEDKGITSDILVWKNINYRVARELPYGVRGYYGAIAVRMAGQ